MKRSHAMKFGRLLLIAIAAWLATSPALAANNARTSAQPINSATANAALIAAPKVAPLGITESLCHGRWYSHALLGERIHE